MIKLLLKISPRERIMLGALAIVGLLIWGSNLLDRWDTTSQARDAAQREARTQATWLGNEGFLRRQLEQTMERLDASKMLSEAGLIALVDGYARENQIRHELVSPTVTTGKVYDQTSLRVTLRNVSMEQLLNFHLFILERNPYVSMEAIALLPNRADPRLINARLRLESIYIHEEPSR